MRESRLNVPSTLVQNLTICSFHKSLTNPSALHQANAFKPPNETPPPQTCWKGSWFSAPGGELPLSSAARTVTGGCPAFSSVTLAPPPSAARNKCWKLFCHFTVARQASALYSKWGKRNGSEDGVKGESASTPGTGGRRLRAADLRWAKTSICIVFSAPVDATDY